MQDVDCGLRGPILLPSTPGWNSKGIFEFAEPARNGLSVFFEVFQRDGEAVVELFFLGTHIPGWKMCLLKKGAA
ncbi:MAG: hypothetical protein B7X91_04560 [Hydrogenophilales bacterium 17-64-11]|nr:MAG: hypothetical protein B7Y33_01085 [Hydrogenophilales bacterium 16-62-9]OZA28721.1 MAG: hypothetical protein B7X91_04560 [Hydrogenophilales bacterium 17-64-11]